MKNRALMVINVLLFLSVAFQLFTGLFEDQVHELFEATHESNGVILGLLTAGHLALNWRWVVNSYFKRKRTAVGTSAEAE